MQNRPLRRPLCQVSTDPENNLRETKTLKRRNHAGRAEKLFDDSKTQTARRALGRSSPSAVAFDRAPLANGSPATEGKINPPKEKKANNSIEDARPFVGHESANTGNRELSARGAEPRGISNEANACYVNSALQVIVNIPEVAEHYRGLADKVLPEVAAHVARNADAFKGHRTGAKNRRAREELKLLLEGNKSKM